jgi:hypothetical protein
MSGLSNTINMAQMRASMRGEDPEEAVQQELLKVLQNDPDLLKFPNSTFGFKLTNPDVAVRHIARLESHLKEAIDQKAPQLKGRVARQRIGAAEFLTLRLDGSLVPWDELLAKGEFDEETIQKLKERLQPATFTFGLGVRENYLIV